MADEAKRRILERRAQFVAAAIASIGTSVGAMSCEREPTVCLSAVPIEMRDAGTQTTPPPDAAAAMPCLEPMPADAGPRPLMAPCLSPRYPRDGAL